MNDNLSLTLDDCVAEVLGMLTGLDLTYSPERDRYRAITRALNRAVRAHALEHEWSYYSDVEEVGTVSEGDQEFALRATVRPRIVNDDAVRLVDSRGDVKVWAYFLPRDALHKYNGRGGLWCSVTRSTLTFSRPLGGALQGLTVQVPVMREPNLFRLPPPPEESDDEIVPVPQEVREQLLDYDYPDAIVLKAAYYYAQTDPVMQPRVPTLEEQYKDLMYALVERDDRNTDAPFMNEFFVPIVNSIDGPDRLRHRHPHSDERRW